MIEEKEEKEENERVVEEEEENVVEAGLFVCLHVAALSFSSSNSLHHPSNLLPISRHVNPEVFPCSPPPSTSTAV